MREFAKIRQTLSQYFLPAGVEMPEANPEQTLAIVTDSTSDIPGDLAQIFGIHVIPNIIVIEGQSVEDGKGLTREEFYERLPKMTTLPVTGTASAGAYEQLYSRLLEQGFQEILSIHASSLLSGILNAAHTAAESFAGRAHVFDSLSVTMGLGYQVMAAAEWAREGLPVKKVIDRLESLRPRARVIAMLDTLEYVRRSGRVSWAKAQLGNLLRIKPFIEVRDGLVRSLGEVRTRRKGIERLLRIFTELGAIERLAVLHTNAEAEARELLAAIEGLHLLSLREAPLVVNVTTVVGTHAGPGALGLAVVLKG